MVKTRGALVREKLSHPAEEEKKSEVLSRKVHSEILFPKNELKEIAQQMSKREGSLNINLGGPASVVSKKCSSRSSVSAQRKQLELEAAEAKAEIERNLIEKRLAAKLAALESASPHSSRRSQASRADSVAEASNKVEEWLNKSQQELQQQRAASPPPAQPAVPCTSDLQLLARTMEQMATATYSAQSKLLSRLSTPRDLPLFFGDPLEWLQYKNSYEESSKLCNYSDSENVTRLCKSLRGEAKEAVSSLLISNSNPSAIMEALELRFGRPELIIHKIATQFKKLQPLPHAYHTELVTFAVKVKNYVAAAESIKQSDYLGSPELLNTAVSKCPSVLIDKWADYFYDHQDGSKTKLQIFAEFLHREATKVASAGISHIHSQADHRLPKKNDERKTQVHSVLQSSEESSKCKVCRNAAHPLSSCTKFKRALRKDKWRIVKVNRLCHKCLLPGHSREACPAAPCVVDECGMAHHRLLHWPAKKTVTPCDVTSDNVPSATNLSSESANNKDLTVTNTTILCSSTSVLLKIVRVNIHGPKGVITTHALLDDGATVSLISADLANCINIKGQPETIRIRGAWNSDIVCQSEIVNFKLSSNDNKVYELRARKINELDLPTQCLSKVNINAYEHLRDLKDYLCNSDIKPKLLIGQDNYHLLVSLKTIYRGKNEPCATLTPLGWCLHGIVPTNAIPSSRPRRHRTIGSFSTELAHTTTMQAVAPTRVAVPLSAATAGIHLARRETHTSAGAPTFAMTQQWETTAHIDNTDKDECLHELVRRHFAFESIGVNSKPRVNKDELRAIDCIEKSAKLINGQWEVCLPWKNDSNDMPNNYQNAFKRYLGVEKKMQSDPSYATRYKQRMYHLFDNDYARQLTDKEISTPRKHIWYLPHFGVDNPNKNKLRLVFDAAAVTAGRCLNDYLLQGPDLLQSLLGIMLRFREKPVAFVGDIKDMFLRVKISEEDQHALRFLWREHRQSNIDTYAMTSLIFGANCSPFIAQYIKNKNAMLFEHEMPEAVQAILKSHYMDDYIESVDDEQKASQLIREVSEIHRRGGFQIRNWTCNKPEVLECAPKETLSEKAIKMKTACDDAPERTLGLLWFPLSDTFGFDLSLKRIPPDVLNSQRVPTKRELLRVVMSIFDIFGFLAPFTIKAKIALQNIWKSNTKWDEGIPEKENKVIQRWLVELQKLQHLRIPRCHFPIILPERERDNYNLPQPCASVDVPSQKEKTIEMHIFCDASPSAYAAVAYYREITKSNGVRISFIACKYRASPIHKYITVPKLELQAAVIACRLAETIARENRLVIDKRYFWTDSIIVLHQIKNDTRNYKVFVANRLGEIDELSQSSEWNYVPTEMNIADKATKINTYELTNTCEWFQGPRFLYSSPEYWPKYKPEKEKIINEELLQVNTLCNIENTDLPVPDPTKFSTWLRLLRCATNVLLFIEKCRSTRKAENNTELRQRAENLILRQAQIQSFAGDFHLLKNKKPLDANSRLRTLTPYVDEFDLLRVGGRIGAASDVTPELKNPVILDGRHPTAKLIVKYYHEQAAHGNNEMVVNEIRQKYWLLHLRPTVRSVASRCLTCRIRKAQPTNPRLGDLPEARLAHHQRAFSFCAADLFGPMEVAVGRRREKRYGVLFTCLTVRAIHIELVPSLSADSFIMALRRMAARRGWPSKMFSDNGTNFRGAATEIKKAMHELIQPDVKDQLVNKGVDWQFICPGSPHMGGAWERLIRSVKTTLKVVLKERAPREEVLITLLAEIENLVNSRPLCHVSTEHGYPETLTPNHFLIGSSSNLPVPGVFTDCDTYCRKQWRISQRLTDMFWKRWIREILPTLLPRQKWCQEGPNLKPGDVVIIVDQNQPRNTWPKGLIEKIYPGADGRVRVADVKTKTGTLTRPVTRLAVLPTTSDDCP